MTEVVELLCIMVLLVLERCNMFMVMLGYLISSLGLKYKKIIPIINVK